MYDRAPRSLTKPADSTERSVGPGSYEAPEYGPTKYGTLYIHEQQVVRMRVSLHCLNLGICL